MTPIALTIAGSDPSGGAGIQADLKTFHRFGVYGEAVVTLLTVQNTRSVSRVEVLDARLVIEQIEAVIADIPPMAAKTGALGSSELIFALAERAASFDFPLVLDPVMISKHGMRLVPDAAINAIRDNLLPTAYLVTPNLFEAAVLTGRSVETVEQMRDAASMLVDLGARAALVKGGHLNGEPVDVLMDGEQIHYYRARRVDTPHTHGAGCTYSAAITALLATGLSLSTAVRNAKEFVTRAIDLNPGLGGGAGPLNHWA